jgi:hypothetical protein
MTLPDLADECVMMEHGNALDDIPAETVKQMYMSLYHTHIPKLVEASVVEYDQESDSVALGPNATQLEPHRTLARSELSTSVAKALSELRSGMVIDDGLTTEQAKEVLQRADYDDGVAELLNRLENRGYIYIIDGRVRLID